MKNIIQRSILTLGATGLMLMAQSSPPQNPPSGQTPTQGSTNSDTQMATKVRQALMQDQSVGTAAHNVRVTAHNGTVVLRGKVNSSDEKDAIVAKAKQVAGDANIKDEITVAKSSK